jgi:hypothetical protein
VGSGAGVVASNRFFDGRYDDAKFAIDEMRKKFPHFEPHDFIHFYASMEERLGNPEAAIRMLQRAVEEGPDCISRHHSWVSIL